LRSLLFVLAALALLFGIGWLAVPALTSFSATSDRYLALEPSLMTEADRGIAYFAVGDFSALTSETLRVSASPWKLSVAALALKSVDGNLDHLADVDIAALFRRFGFHTPKAIGNWPSHLPPPSFETPIGQNVGFGGRAFLPIGATIGNVGCPACHSSVMYDESGNPDTSRIWLGAPNGSINLEAYTVALYEAFGEFGKQPDVLMEAVARLYPDTGWREKLTLRHFIIPELRKTFAEREASIGRLLPFRASLAGATNGLDSLKSRLGLIPDGKLVTESTFNSIPDLGGLLWRTKFLNSGNYAIPGHDHTRSMQSADITPEHRRGLAAIISYFTVPSMGVTPEVAETSIGHAFEITTWMEHYAPQPFPGRIDRSLLPRGQAVYAQACASCHGSYTPNLEQPHIVSFPNWEGDIGTDPQRHRLLDKVVADAVNASLYGRYIDARTVSTYTAPPLTGLWSSAPYFHNGSVPTLWHFMHPGERPTRFTVGGHRLDLDKVGIAGIDDGKGGWNPPPRYTPWSIPVEVDTTAFGLGNGGHEAELTNLTEADKTALLEYLKLL
jgi:hypothetical protein